MTQVAYALTVQDAAPTGLRGLVLRRGADKARRHPGTFKVRSMSVWRASLIAIGSLALFFGISIGLMLAGGVVTHALDPRMQLDIFAAFHNWWVVGILLGITVLWLLPPHPWAKESLKVPTRDDPEPRFPEPVTGAKRVVVVSVYQGRAPPLISGAFSQG